MGSATGWDSAWPTDWAAHICSVFLGGGALEPIAEDKAAERAIKDLVSLSLSRSLSLALALSLSLSRSCSLSRSLALSFSLSPPPV